MIEIKFEDLYINERVKKGLKDLNYYELTKIQEEVMPFIFDEEDLIAIASTGSGKTAAFCIPLINNILKEKERFKIRGLILAPTRELAMQIHDNIVSYSKYTNIRSLAVIGGVKESIQKSKVDVVDIIVATPGRLIDFINQKIINLKLVNYLVIDEADKLLDMGFIDDIHKIISKLSCHQTLLFSATMSDKVKKLTQEILNDYKEVETTRDTLDIKQYYFDVNQADKIYLLKDLIRQNNMKNILIFCKTKNSANKVSNFLRGNNISSNFINKDKSQVDRQKALNEFKNKKIDTLVATDILSRGIDAQIDYIINFDLPSDITTYKHRIGRTARIDDNGIAISFFDESEKYFLNNIKSLYKIELLKK